MKEKETEQLVRESGIDLLGSVVWGTHVCLFYKTKQDLINILVPYFKAGLENNEFCMWITCDPLDPTEAKNAIRKAIPDSLTNCSVSFSFTGLLPFALAELLL